MNASGPRLLVVDDEPAIRRFLRTALAAQGFQVFEAAAGQAGLDGVLAHRPDLVILDWGLPDLDGVEVLRRLRAWSAVPVIMLTVREAEADKIAALDAGADDYLTKPFGAGELLARIRAALRRAAAPAAGEAVFQNGDLSVDLARRVVRRAGAEVALTPTEYDLLRVLVVHAGKVLTHTHLLREVWGAGYDDLHMLRVNISNLRRKIEPDPARPRYVVTEPGVGYRLRVAAE
ncbi:MAG: response regulator [Anaerolineales bacterium]|nr:response regulator [Anaerolineales bacterium]